MPGICYMYRHTDIYFVRVCCDYISETIVIYVYETLDSVTTLDSGALLLWLFS